MAQFVAINKNVEVNGETVLSFINSMESGKDKRLAILEKYNIAPEPGKWYLQQGWLDAFKEVSRTTGEMNLFLIGKAIIEHAKFPPIKDLEEGLRLIDVAYHMNHRLNGRVMFDGSTGKMAEGIGHYKLEKYDSENKHAIMVCNNPYPSKFDEGIIAQMCRKFKPADSLRESVKLDATKETRKKGGDSCTFIIEW